MDTLFSKQCVHHANPAKQETNPLASPYNNDKYQRQGREICAGWTAGVCGAEQRSLCCYVVVLPTCSVLYLPITLITINLGLDTRIGRLLSLRRSSSVFLDSVPQYEPRHLIFPGGCISSRRDGTCPRAGYKSGVRISTVLRRPIIVRATISRLRRLCCLFDAKSRR